MLKQNKVMVMTQSYLLIKPLHGCPKPLWYSSNQPVSLFGIHLVLVAIKNRLTWSIILQVGSVSELDCPVNKVLPIQEMGPTIQDNHFFAWLKFAAQNYALEWNSLLNKALNQTFLQRYNRYRSKNHFQKPQPFQGYVNLKLDSKKVDQLNTWIRHGSTNKTFQGLLLQASSEQRWQTYLLTITQNLRANKSCLFLLPSIEDVELAQQYFNHHNLTHPNIFYLHTHSTPKAQHELWLAIEAAQAVVVIGVQMPIWIPLVNLGLIIVEQEQDNFTQQGAWELDYKQLAIWRAQCSNASIILGAALPSISWFYKAQNLPAWQTWLWQEQLESNLPISIFGYPSKPNKSNGQKLLAQEIVQGLTKTILEQNNACIITRRPGSHTALLCQQCGLVFKCEQCLLTQEIYETANERILRCVNCGTSRAYPEQCSNQDCQSLKLSGKGIGLQRLLSWATKQFIQANALALQETEHWRLGKKHLPTQHCPTALANNNPKIWIGTNLNRSNLYKLGIKTVILLGQETSLAIPHYQARERMWHKLAMIAGAEKRPKQRRELWLQCFMPNQWPIGNLGLNSWQQFVAQELEQRKALGYPPFSRLIALHIQNTDHQALEQDSATLKQHLEEWLLAASIEHQILGPVSTNSTKNGLQKLILCKILQPEKLTSANSWQLPKIGSTLKCKIDF